MEVSVNVSNLDVMVIILGLREMQANAHLYAESIVECAEKLEYQFCDMVVNAHVC